MRRGRSLYHGGPVFSCPARADAVAVPTRAAVRRRGTTPPTTLGPQLPILPPPRARAPLLLALLLLLRAFELRLALDDRVRFKS
jgi:hypothetical protein